MEKEELEKYAEMAKSLFTEEKGNKYFLESDLTRIGVKPDDIPEVMEYLWANNIIRLEVKDKYLK